jgi:hypothetical protein
MAMQRVLSVASVAAAIGGLLAAPAALAQVPPAGHPATGPPPGFGGSLVSDPAFSSQPPPQSRAQPVTPPGSQPESQPPDRLRLVGGSLSGRVVKLRVICQVSGKLTLRTPRGGKRLAAKRFLCRTASQRVRLRLTRTGLRSFRRSGEMLVILTGGGETHRYRLRFGASARASAYGYWGEGYCGIDLGTVPGVHAGQSVFRLNPGPITVSVPGGGPDVGWVRFYWYRYGVGWVGDSGWGEPFDIPEGPGAIYITQRWDYTLRPDQHAWYVGAIAIYGRNAARGDWYWVSTFPRNHFNPVLGNIWCGTDP